jgi:hypothetical protein
MVPDDASVFADAIRMAVASACAEWGYGPVSNTYFVTFDSRVPAELQARVGAGIREGLITVDRYYFRAVGLPPKKGPYKLVGRSQTGAPQPHWEYYVQLAEYVRLVRVLGSAGLTIGLEDGLMDITVRRDGGLLWAVEVKENAAKLLDLQAAFRRYGSAVPLARPDRGNDGLRKSKYLVLNRPPFFSLLALGARFDYAMSYPAETSFRLELIDNEAVIEARVVSG